VAGCGHMMCRSGQVKAVHVQLSAAEYAKDGTTHTRAAKTARVCDRKCVRWLWSANRTAWTRAGYGGGGQAASSGQDGS